MKKIYVLDQTLREGGYVNHFKFGHNTISEIISGLTTSNIDIIECGFVRANSLDLDYTIFSSMKQIDSMFKSFVHRPIAVGMVEISKYTQEDVLFTEDKSNNGVRLSFHEHEQNEAINIAKSLIESGYKVFLQPIGYPTLRKESINNLFKSVNIIKPYALYIVDTFGQMLTKDIETAAKLFDRELSSDIILGFHSHNNSLMSFSNALTIINEIENRDIVIDASIAGLGRGAGTIRTEMLTHYLNLNYGTDYDVGHLLTLSEQCIKNIVNNKSVCTDIVYYFSAAYGCHPNYADYLLKEHSLSLRDLYYIIKSIDNTYKVLFNKHYIMTLTEQYKTNLYEERTRH